MQMFSVDWQKNDFDVRADLWDVVYHAAQTPTTVHIATYMVLQ